MSGITGGGAGVALTGNAPISEATTAAVGAGSAAARDDHVHPRLSSTTVQTTDTNGVATVAFTRTFPAAKKPGVVLTGYDTNSQPLMFEVTGFQTDGGGNFTGCTVKVYRTRTLPATLTLLTDLLNFNIVGGAASNVEFSCVAIMASN